MTNIQSMELPWCIGVCVKTHSFFRITLKYLKSKKLNNTRSLLQSKTERLLPVITLEPVVTDANETGDSHANIESDLGLHSEVDIKLELLKEEPEDTSEDYVEDADDEDVTDAQISSAIKSWPSTDSDDEDLNFDDEDDDILIPSIRPTLAEHQPANDPGFSTAEINLLEREDDLDNKYIAEYIDSQAPAYKPDYLKFDWTCDRQTFTGVREAFTGTPGPTFPVTDDLTIVDIFYKMFESQFIDLMVTETNRYAEQMITKMRGDPFKENLVRDLRWEKTDRNEMVAFLALMILQGLHPKVKEELYFSSDGFGTTPYFSRIMSYRRYLLLKTFHHFVDNETLKDTNKLRKVQPVIDYLNSKFSSLYKPDQEVTIDESSLEWYGRLDLSQKMATKACLGVKVYELSECNSGYLWKFIVFAGKDGSNRTCEKTNYTGDKVCGQRDGSHDKHGKQTKIDDRLKNHPTKAETVTKPVNDDGLDYAGPFCCGQTEATSKVVLDLMDPLLHKGHTLIMDCFFNSPLLARYLKWDGKTDVYGTLRIMREFLPESMRDIEDFEMRVGEVAFSYCPDLSVFLWRDAGYTSMISTYHHCLVGLERKHDRAPFYKYKPDAVLNYNKSMVGVDRREKCLASQPLERQKYRVWYKNLFQRLYNKALYNCFVIFTSNSNKKKLDHRQFRTTLAEDLLKIHRKIDLVAETRLLKQPHRNMTANTEPTTTAAVAITPTTMTLSSNNLKRPRRKIDLVAETRLLKQPHRNMTANTEPATTATVAVTPATMTLSSNNLKRPRILKIPRQIDWVAETRLLKQPHRNMTANTEPATTATVAVTPTTMTLSSNNLKRPRIMVRCVNSLNQVGFIP